MREICISAWRSFRNFYIFIFLRFFLLALLLVSLSKKIFVLSHGLLVFFGTHPLLLIRFIFPASRHMGIRKDLVFEHTSASLYLYLLLSLYILLIVRTLVIQALNSKRGVLQKLRGDAGRWFKHARSLEDVYHFPYLLIKVEERTYCCGMWKFNALLPVLKIYMGGSSKQLGEFPFHNSFPNPFTSAQTRMRTSRKPPAVT